MVGDIVVCAIGREGYRESGTLQVPTEDGPNIEALIVTRRTAETTIAVAATNGAVRPFSGGQIILNIDSEVVPRPVCGLALYRQ